MELLLTVESGSCGRRCTSATLAAFVRDARRVELNSYDQKMQKNADGSIDVYFGPVALASKEANWIYTAPGKPWIALFRFYGPEKALLDKTWKLPDL